LRIQTSPRPWWRPISLPLKTLVIIWIPDSGLINFLPLGALKGKTLFMM
jgi:hypothetical protein